jgi:hypothetical protein
MHAERKKKSVDRENEKVRRKRKSKNIRLSSEVDAVLGLEISIHSLLGSLLLSFGSLLLGLGLLLLGFGLLLLGLLFLYVGSPGRMQVSPQDVVEM